MKQIVIKEPDRIIEEIDRIIKEIWLNNIRRDYKNLCLLREDTLKNALYYHLRRKLSRLLRKNSLRIYTEYYIEALRYRADIAIVKIDEYSEEKYLKNSVTEILAVFELKFKGSGSARTQDAIMQDTQKMKHYLQNANLGCQCYFAVIYERECDGLCWLNGRATRKWASGKVTELNAGYVNDRMEFEVNSYNEMNRDLSGIRLH